MPRLRARAHLAGHEVAHAAAGLVRVLPQLEALLEPRLGVLLSVKKTGGSEKVGRLGRSIHAIYKRVPWGRAGGGGRGAAWRGAGAGRATPWARNPAPPCMVLGSVLMNGRSIYTYTSRHRHHFRLRRDALHNLQQVERRLDLPPPPQGLCHQSERVGARGDACSVELVFGRFV